MKWKVDVMKDGLMERGEGVKWKVDVMKDGLME